MLLDLSDADDYPVFAVEMDDGSVYHVRPMTCAEMAALSAQAKHPDFELGWYDRLKLVANEHARQVLEN